MNTIHFIQQEDDAKIAAIIRANLEHYHLDIPGTVYFDPELDHLSQYYAEKPEKRAYFILTDETAGQVIGGIGIAEFSGFENCAEIQKLYLTDTAKGKGLGQKLLKTAEEHAKNVGYQSLYLETHSVLRAAIHLYEKMGFYPISRPQAVLHSTMNTFYRKEI